MTLKAKGSYLGPKHLEQITLSYTHFIENAQAKPSQHYMRVIMTMWGKMEQTTMMKLSWLISYYYCTPGIVDSCLGGRATFFEECVTSKGPCGLVLSLSGKGCQLSLGIPLHDILSHLS